MAIEKGDNSCHWSDLVRRITAGDSSGVEQLYVDLRDLVRGKFLSRFSHLAGEYGFDDSVHEVLLIVLEAIQRGQLRDPAKLPGFVRTVARRRVIAQIRAAQARRRFAAGLEARSSDSPETRLTSLEKARRVRAALARLSVRDREILERFYYKEQPAEQICGEMHLTGTQFRLYKSRAIARCSHLIVLAAANPPIPAGWRTA